ncbi:MAG: hypothetical protein IN808_03085, partial [Rubrobacter sp.]|nr:hypothetical protein [Rubrobacter sp.]
LVDLLLGLDGTRPLKEVLGKLAASHGLGDKELRALEDALGRLKERGIVHEL